MSFDWSLYLDVARELQGDTTSAPTPESKCRAAISRAYYVCHCSLRNVLQRKGITVPTTGKAHQEVIEELANLGGIATRLSKDLGRLKDARRKADYEDHFRGFSGTAYQSIVEAEGILNDMKKI